MKSNIMGPDHSDQKSVTRHSKMMVIGDLIRISEGVKARLKEV